MLEMKRTYTDYNGSERTETFYFNLSKAECMEMEMSTTGGMTQLINNIIAAQDTAKLIGLFKDVIRRSYGVKSPDGKRMVKGDKVFEEFSQTEAYSDLFMELATDSDKAAKFINGIMPKDNSNSSIVVPMN